MTRLRRVVTLVAGAALLALLVLAAGGRRRRAHEAADATATGQRQRQPDEDDEQRPSERVHAFYYAWFAAPAVDGRWLHWNHARLPHWDPRTAARFSREAHTPPHDIASAFYPALGPYSSADRAVMADHMRQLRTARVGVIAVSWYHPTRGDPNGASPDPVMRPLMDVAHEHGIKVAFHLEPYHNRTAASVREDLQYIAETYGVHPALYRHRGVRDDKPATLPLMYVYDSYLTPNAEWQQLLSPSGSLSVRGTPMDAFFIGLLVTRIHVDDLYEGGFDGMYTYFASEGFTPGSTPSLWADFAAAARLKKMLFIPSIGPGYDDGPVRPWNAATTKARGGGAYYERLFRAAAAQRPALVSVTSFNEWGEGTQIETAVPFTDANTGAAYADYGPAGPEHYLRLTARFSAELEAS
eukprot:Unigene16745_Nuclearia_a/m.49425 Unigene16745_Nuclearia_a/g.49425  ORF Unigene16745_Nuclearia_a/g.49425 Unigene16745_Nuclearia_a/m.49425 type:complete len:411 (-) Unigene16745_Nuclearia_a:39-1271(-)